MKHTTCDTKIIHIYVSGDDHAIRNAMSEYCLTEGFCVSIEKTTYYYTMGIEDGAKITVINYPRFPASLSELMEISVEIAEIVIAKCHQGSATVVGPVDTVFISRRK